MSFILCIGEALIDFVAQSRARDVGQSEIFRRAAGGAVANVAVGIARLGGHARFAGTLSRDAFGRYLLRTLAHENVNVDGVRIVDAATTLAFVSRDEQGERDFIFLRNPGADSMLEPEDIGIHEVSSSRIVHFGGVLLVSEPARSACFAAAAAAREAGKFVSFDVNARPALWRNEEEMRRQTFAACAAATLVKLSEDDARMLGIEDDGRTLVGGATQAVVVTRGAHGATYRNGSGESGKVLVPRVEVVDTTGAGDAATAAILWRLEKLHLDLGRSSLDDAVRHGCAAGTLATLREGAIPSLPTAAQVEAMLARLPQTPN